MPCLTKVSVATCLWLCVCSAKGCEFLNYRPYHNHSMVVHVDSDPCSRDLYRCGLQCQRDSECRAFMDSEYDGVEAVCSETPGLLHSSAVYVIRRDVRIQGNICPLACCYISDALKPSKGTPGYSTGILGSGLYMTALKYHTKSSVEYITNSLAWALIAYMMTSSNGNVFRVTGHLCGEFTGPRWIPHTKASDAELWCFLWSAPE